MLESPRIYAFRFPKEDSAELTRLKGLSSQLADDFRWIEGGATLFLLTGMYQWVQTIRSSFEECPEAPCLSRIILEVDPAMPPKYVAAQYQAERDRLRPRWRSLSNKHLKLAQRAAMLPAATWRELWEEWNSLHVADGWGYTPQIVTPTSPEERRQHEEHMRKLLPNFDGSFARHPYKLAWPGTNKQWDRYIEKRDSAFASFRRDTEQSLRRVWDPINGQNPQMGKREVGRSKFEEFLATRDADGDALR
ncbi:MAG: hypothetical protein H0W86_09155 [Armatimonadetes bacterium]|nr:hypothetical protein [Armatimonadota bacterium]